MRRPATATGPHVPRQSNRVIHAGTPETTRRTHPLAVSAIGPDRRVCSASALDTTSSDRGVPPTAQLDSAPRPGAAIVSHFSVAEGVTEPAGAWALRFLSQTRRASDGPTLGWSEFGHVEQRAATTQHRRQCTPMPKGCGLFLTTDRIARNTCRISHNSTVSAIPLLHERLYQHVRHTGRPGTPLQQRVEMTNPVHRCTVCHEPRRSHQTRTKYSAKPRWRHRHSHSCVVHRGRRE